MFGHCIPQNKFCDLLILMAIISQKQTLATVNSLKVVEIVLSKILELTFTVQNMKFSIKNFTFTEDLVTFTEDILNGKLHF